MLKPLLIAMQLLTRLPVPSVNNVQDKDYGLSVLFYPLIGLFIGAVLYATALLADAYALPQHVVLVAAILLATWVFLSGAIHLDGLADSADAWLGGFGDRQRTLEIMKDPRSGSAAIVVVVMVLILKFAALVSLWQTSMTSLVIIPLLARAFIIALFLTTPYVRKNGIGSRHSQTLPVTAAWYVLVLVVAACGYFFQASLVVPLIAAMMMFLLLRSMMVKRIGGMTGDTAGASVEILETVLLTSFALQV